MELDKILETRRAYRSFEETEINVDAIKKIYDSLKLTPSCYNKQPWRYVFVNEKTMLEKTFTALSEGNIWAKKASMIIAVLSKKDLDCMMPDGRDYYKFDTGMATAVLILKATELGYVAHPIAGYDPAKIKKTLSIPEEMEVLTLIIVGKKAKEVSKDLNPNQQEVEKNRPPRKAQSEIISFNQFSADS